MISSLSITTTISQSCRSFARIWGACSLLPCSKASGAVTAPTVIAPFFLAVLATSDAIFASMLRSRHVAKKTMSIWVKV